MKTLPLVMLLITVCCSSSPSSPIFIWSGSPSEGVLSVTQATTSFSPLNSVQLEQHLRQIFSESDVDDHGGPLSGYLRQGEVKPPATLVVFIKSVLTSSQFSRLADAYSESTSGGALRFLRSVVSSSASSLTIPYSQVTSLLESVVDPLASLLNSKDESILFAGLPDSSLPVGQSVSMDNLLPTLQSKKEAPRLVVVYLHEDYVEDSEQDALMEKVTQHISKVTGGDYLALYGGDNYVVSPARHQRERREQQKQKQQQQQGPLAVSYFTRGVWAWLALVIFLVVMVFWAISQLSGLQVPPRLLDEARARSKKNK